MALYIDGKLVADLYHNGRRIKEAWYEGKKVYRTPWPVGTVLNVGEYGQVFTRNWQTDTETALTPGVWVIQTIEYDYLRVEYRGETLENVKVAIEYHGGQLKISNLDYPDYDDYRATRIK